MVNILREQRGSYAVLSALFLTCLFGFAALALDVGILYMNRVEMINLTDAAALAGARDLPGSPGNAVSSAGKYAALNGQTGDTVNSVVGSGNTSLTVNATRTVDMTFARLFGLNSALVSATATASLSGISGYSGVVPFGVVKSTYVSGQQVTLKQGSGNSTDGNFGALSLGGNGANVYLNNLENGYSGLLSVGDTVYTEPGNIVGPTTQGVNYRINQDTSATASTVLPGSARFVIVPIIDSLNVNGKSPVLIDGFAAFFLESTNGGAVQGQFLQYATDTNTVPGGNNTYGLSSIMLTQ
jgi:Flp pilus assembly protein TadG